MREYAALMEGLGYDELWLSEHHSFYDGYCPALLPAAASVLSVTERLRVGTGMLLLDWQLGLVVLAGFIPLTGLTVWFRRESARAYRRE